MRAAFSPIIPSTKLNGTNRSFIPNLKCTEAYDCRFSGSFSSKKDDGKTYLQEMDAQDKYGTPLSLNTKIMINRVIYVIESKQVKLGLLTKGDFLDAIKNYKALGRPNTGIDLAAMKSAVKKLAQLGLGLLDRPAAPEEIEGVTREGIAWDRRKLSQ